MERERNAAETSQTSAGSKPKVRLKVTDRETGESRACDIEQAKAWDWRDQETWRIIGGWQITSYAMLLKVLQQKAEKGIEEVEMLEAPRFTMLSGG